jgi:UDP-glucose 4-epimerase
MMDERDKDLAEDGGQRPPYAVFAGKDALVTGGMGFIGSHLARRLVDLGARVTIVDSMIPDYGGNPYNIHDFRDRVTVNVADVRDRDGMNQLVRGRDYLFNLAGQVSHIDSMRDPATDLEINCRAQLSILEACRHNNPDVRLVFTSTRQVYGRPRYLPLDEEHPCHPIDVNGINKLAAEGYHRLYNDIYGLRAVSLRLTNTYGPGQLVKHARQGFMGWFLRKVVEGGEIEIFGDGLQLRDLNFVEDVVDAMLRAAASGAVWGEVFNLGSDAPISLKDLVESMIDAAGAGSYRLTPFPEDRARIDIGSCYCSFEKIRRALGWTPRTPLRDGLERTICYYRDNLRHYV